MTKISIQFFQTSFGELILGSFKDGLCLCDWRFRKMRSEIDERIQRGLKTEYEENESPVIKEAITQLNEYFRGEREKFDVPLKLIGTSFQQKVWNELQNIPFGKTLTYLKLSQILGDENAIRAVASANGANAIAIFIPCHRIIGRRGELTGYAGGLHAKRKLLQLESKNESADQLQLFP